MNHDYKSLAGFLSPYLEIEGIEAAALVSSEGLLVAAAGGSGLDLEALAAYGAPSIASADRLAAVVASGGDKTLLVASEGGKAAGMAIGRTNTIVLGLPDHDLVLAPLNSDLFLLLVGRQGFTAAGVHGLAGP